MKTNVETVNRDADIQFLQKMGTALLLTALLAGSVTVFGVASSRSGGVDVNLWLTSQLAVVSESPSSTDTGRNLSCGSAVFASRGAINNSKAEQPTEPEAGSKLRKPPRPSNLQSSVIRETVRRPTSRWLVQKTPPADAGGAVVLRQEKRAR